MVRQNVGELTREELVERIHDMEGEPLQAIFVQELLGRGITYEMKQKKSRPICPKTDQLLPGSKNSNRP